MVRQATSYLLSANTPPETKPRLNISNIISGKLDPLIGGVCAVCVASSVGEANIVGEGLADWVTVGVRLADGVASPNTCVPLLKIENV
jgi:hypothetical protein